MRFIRFIIRGLFFLAVFAVAGGVGSLGYFHFAPPKDTCFTCHEMHTSHDQWASSAHQNIHCRECHGGSLTLDVHALKAHANRVVGHFQTERHEDIRLDEQQVIAVSDRCRSCHESQHAAWLSGGHSASYAAIFLDKKHNSAELLSADCLRCHGMFHEGTIEDLVTPISKTGPWQFKDPAKAHQPAMPCLACHQIHTEDQPAKRPDYADPKLIAASRDLRNATSGLFNRREKLHFPAGDLPIPAIMSEGKPVAVSTDPRQRLCVQCHAPNSVHQAGTSDDRTPRGVHEGLSCMACHKAHSNDARASCATCHPALSNCGLDVAKMDTSFLSPSSKHNVHFVACTDCHSAGRPQKKVLPPQP